MRPLTFLALMLIVLLAGFSWAQAQDEKPPFTLIITHAATKWDRAASAATGIGTAVRYAKAHGAEIIHLSHVAGTPKANDVRYYVKPPFSSELQSNGGELNLIPEGRIILTGGYFEGCLKNTLAHLLVRALWNGRPIPDFYYVMDAVYTGREGVLPRTLEERLRDERLPESETFYLLSSRLRLAEMFDYLDPQNHERPRLSQFSFEFRRGEALLGTYGSGSQRVVLHFVTSRELVEGRAPELPPIQAGKPECSRYFSPISAD